MKIYLARHGRTNYNDLGLCNADPSIDVHLTDTGKSQAKALAEKLKSVDLDRIYVSELKRTLQTAEIVNQYHGVDILTDKRLNDGRSGFEGKHFSEYDAALDSSTDKWTVRFNDGESIQDIRDRAEKFLKDMESTGLDSVLIVTSAWIIQALLAILQNLTFEESWELDIQQGDFIELEV